MSHKRKKRTNKVVASILVATTLIPNITIPAYCVDIFDDKQVDDVNLNETNKLVINKENKLPTEQLTTSVFALNSGSESSSSVEMASQFNNETQTQNATVVPATSNDDSSDQNANKEDTDTDTEPISEDFGLSIDGSEKAIKTTEENNEQNNCKEEQPSLERQQEDVTKQESVSSSNSENTGINTNLPTEEGGTSKEEKLLENSKMVESEPLEEEESEDNKLEDDLLVDTSLEGGLSEEEIPEELLSVEQSMLFSAPVPDNDLISVNLTATDSLEEKLIEITAEYGMEPSNIKRVKISGQLNAESYAFIRELKLLEYIDLADTDISILTTDQLTMLNLKEIVLPSNLKKIEVNAFNDNLTIYNMPSTLTNVANTTFVGCTIEDDFIQNECITVEMVEDQGHIEFLGGTTLNGNYIANCNGKAYVPAVVNGDVTLEENVTSSTAIEQANSITVKSKSLVTTENMRTFLNARKIIFNTGAINYSIGVVCLGENVEELEIQDNLDTIGINAFTGNAGKVTIVSVRKIEYKAFDGVYGELSLGNEVEYIGTGGIGEVNSKVIIPSSIIALSPGALSGAKEVELNSETVHTNLKEIYTNSVNKNATGKIVETSNLRVIRTDAGDLANTKMEWVLSPAEIDIEVEKVAGKALSESIKEKIAELALSGDYNVKDIKVTGAELSESDFKALNSFRVVDITSIPNTIIPVNAFKDDTTLEEVKISSNVIQIGESAFEGCVNLMGNINLSNVTLLGSKSFKDCLCLASVTLGEVTEIPEQAFESCGLKSISIPKTVREIGGRAFYNCPNVTELVFSRSDEETNYSITSIGDSAFAYLGTSNQEPITVDLPSTIKGSGWGPHAFYSANIIGTISSSKLPTENDEVFYGTKITSIDSDYEGFAEIDLNLNLSVEDQLNSILSEHPECDAVKVTGDLETQLSHSDLEIIKSKKLARIDLSEVIIQDNLIPSGAFRNATYLKEFKFPKNLKEIGSEAFFGCRELTGDICIVTDYTSVGYRAFASCESLNSIKVLSRYVSIGDAAFTGCTNLQGTIDVTKVDAGNGAFLNTKVQYTGLREEENTLIINKDFSQETMQQYYEYALEHSNNTTKLEKIKVICSNGDYLTSDDIVFLLRNMEQFGSATCMDLSEAQIGAEIGAVTTDKLQLNYKEELSVGTLVLPENTVEIKSGSFNLPFNYSKVNIGNVVLPEGLEIIGDGVFVGKYTVNEINFPSTLKYLGRCFFDETLQLYEKTLVVNVNTEGLEFGKDFTSNFKFNSIDGKTVVLKNPVDWLNITNCDIEVVIDEEHAEFYSTLRINYNANKGYCSITTDGDITVKNFVGKSANVAVSFTSTQGNVTLLGDFNLQKSTGQSKKYGMKLSAAGKVIVEKPITILNADTALYITAKSPVDLSIDNEGILTEGMLNSTDITPTSFNLTLTNCTDINNFLKPIRINKITINSELDSFISEVNTSATELDLSEIRCKGESSVISRVKSTNSLEILKLPTFKYTLGNDALYNESKLKEVHLGGCIKLGDRSVYTSNSVERTKIYGNIADIKYFGASALSTTELAAPVDLTIDDQYYLGVCALGDVVGINSVTLKGDAISEKSVFSGSNINKVTLVGTTTIPAYTFNCSYIEQLDLGDNLASLGEYAITCSEEGTTPVVIPGTLKEVNNRSLTLYNHPVSVSGGKLDLTKSSTDSYYAGIVVNNAQQVNIGEVHMENCTNSPTSPVLRAEEGRIGTKLFLNQQEYSTMLNSYSSYFKYPFTCVEDSGATTDTPTELDLTGIEFTSSAITSKLNEKIDMGEVFDLSTEVFKIKCSDKDMTAEGISAIADAGIKIADLTECTFADNKIPDNTLNSNFSGISITFPNTITAVGDNAFQSSTLGIIDFGGNVETIGDNSLYSTTFTSANIGNKLRKIGNKSLTGCTFNFKSAIDITNVESIGIYGSLSSNNGLDINGTLSYNGSTSFENVGVGEGNLKITIPTEVVSIPSYAFRSFDGIVEFEPTDVPKLFGSYAFSRYGVRYGSNVPKKSLDLSNIVIGKIEEYSFENVTVSGDIICKFNSGWFYAESAFKNANLNNLTIYGDPHLINGEFSGATINKVRIVADSYNNPIRLNGFGGCTVNEIECDNIGDISSSAFYYVKGLTKLKNNPINGYAIKIYDTAFAYSKVTSDTFEGFDNVQYIDARAFYGCTNLTDLNWLNLDNVTTIKSQAFMNSGLTSSTEVNTIGKSIDSTAFQGTGVKLINYNESTDISGMVGAIIKYIDYDSDRNTYSVVFKTPEDDKMYNEGNWSKLVVDTSDYDRNENIAEYLKQESIDMTGKIVEFTGLSNRCKVNQLCCGNSTIHNFLLNFSDSNVTSYLELQFNDSVALDSAQDFPALQEVQLTLGGSANYTNIVEEVIGYLVNSSTPYTKTLKITINDSAYFDWSVLKNASGIGIEVTFNQTSGTVNLGDLEIDNITSLKVISNADTKIIGRIHVLNDIENFSFVNEGADKPEDLTIEFDDMSKIIYNDLCGCYIKDLSGLGLCRDNGYIGNMNKADNIRLSDYSLLYKGSNSLYVERFNGSHGEQYEGFYKPEHSIAVDNDVVVSNDDIYFNNINCNTLIINLDNTRDRLTYNATNNFKDCYVDKLIINAAGNFYMDYTTKLPFARVIEINAVGDIEVQAMSNPAGSGNSILEEIYFNSETGTTTIGNRAMYGYTSLRKFGKFKNATIGDEAFCRSFDGPEDYNKVKDSEFPEIENTVVGKHAFFQHFIGEVKIPKGCKVDLSSINNKTHGLGCYLNIEGDVCGELSCKIINEELTLPGGVTSINIGGNYSGSRNTLIPNLKRLTINAENFKIKGKKSGNYRPDLYTYNVLEEINFNGHTLQADKNYYPYLRHINASRDDAVFLTDIRYSQIPIVPGVSEYAHFQNPESIKRLQRPRPELEGDLQIEVGDSIMFNDFTIAGINPADYYTNATNVAATPSSKVFRYVISKNGKELNTPVENLPEGIYDIELFWTPVSTDSMSETDDFLACNVNEYDVKSKYFLTPNGGKLNVKKLIIKPSTNRVTVNVKANGSGRIIGGTTQYGTKNREMTIKFEGVEGGEPTYAIINNSTRVNLGLNARSFTFTPTDDSDVVVNFISSGLKAKGTNIITNEAYLQNVGNSDLEQKITSLTYWDPSTGRDKNIPVENALKINNTIRSNNQIIEDITNLPEGCTSLDLTTDYKLKYVESSKNFKGRNVSISNSMAILSDNSEGVALASLGGNATNAGASLMGLSRNLRTGSGSENSNPLVIPVSEVSQEKLKEIADSKTSEIIIEGENIYDTVSSSIVNSSTKALALMKDDIEVTNLENIEGGEYNLLVEQKVDLSPLSQTAINRLSGLPIVGEYTAKDNYTSIRMVTPVKMFFGAPVQNVNVTVVKTGNGIVSPIGTQSVAKGSSITVTYTPDEGYELDKITVNGNIVTPTELSSQLTNIQEGKTVVIAFKKSKCNLTITSNSGGTVTPSGTEQIPYGDTEVIHIEPNEGYELKQLKVNGVKDRDVLETINPIDYTTNPIKSPTTIEVEFAKTTNTVAITPTPGGSVDPTGEIEVPYGDTVTIDPDPDPGYVLEGIIINGNPVPDITPTPNPDPYTTDPIKEPKVIDVIFKKDKRNVMVSASKGGTVQPLGLSVVEYGDRITIHSVPDATHDLDYIEVNGVKVQDISDNYISNPIIEDTTIYVAFRDKSGTPEPPTPTPPTPEPPTPIPPTSSSPGGGGGTSELESKPEPKKERVKITFRIGDDHWYINDVLQDYVMDQVPEGHNGRAYIPFRFLSYSLKTDPRYVKWNPEERTANIMDGSNYMTLIEGSTKAYLNFSPTELDGFVYVTNGRTMLPISQILGVYRHRNPEVVWDDKEKKVDIYLDLIEDLNPEEVKKNWYEEYSRQLLEHGIELERIMRKLNK